MAQLAISAAGAAVGFVASGFNPVGAQIGWAVGSMVGAQFGPKQKSHGPRLEDLRVTGSEYGQTIPWAAGHPRIAGQVWWASQRREIATTTSQGKGGGGAESTSYSYEMDILYGLTDRVIGGVSRIWLNGKLIYSRLDGSSSATLAASVQNAPWDRITVYTGASDQLPDPTYEAAVTNAPAYRGRGSVFIEGLQLGNSGVIPNLTFEVYFEGDETDVCLALDEDILLQLCMEGTHGSSTFTDSGPFEWAITNEGAPSITTAQKACGVSGGAISSTSGLHAPLPGFETAPFTARFFFKNNGTSDGVWIGRSDQSYSFHGWRLRWQAFANEIIFQNASVPFTTPGANWYSRKWVYPAGFAVHREIVLVVSPGGVGLYIDGAPIAHEISAEVGTFAITYVGAHQPITIGRATANGFGHGMPAPGYYDDVQIITRALTADEITGECTSGIATVDVYNETLQSVVEMLSERCMPAGTYDATALAPITKPVRAFSLSQVATTRSAIEQLMAAYFFEAYITDKLYFVPRAGSVLDTIDADDMGTGLESPEEETLPMQVGSDLEIPAQVSVSYSNIDADYTVATEHSDRLLSGQVSTSVVQLPLGFTAAEGKGIADAIVIDGYASRVTGTFSVPLAYAELVPTDVVAVPDADGNVYRVRIVRRTDEGPLLRFEWVLDDATAIESAGITSDDYTPTVDVALPGDTIMELLDIPLMRDAENTLGHYVAASSSGTTWPGASISRSLDDVEYAEAARVSERAILGVTTTTLAAFTGVGFDEANTVTVRLGLGILSSSTRPGLLADASINNMMIGAELVRFRTATFVSAGVYTLSGLLRGQKGTEWAMAGHTSADVVVLIQTAGIRYVSIDLPSLSAERWYKGVTLGKSLASVSGEAFTCEGVSLKPLAPVNLRRTVGTANQITVTWDRRTRLACTFTGAAGISVPLGELTEAYEVDVVLIAGSVLKRTITASSASAIYTAAMQTADGIGASTPIRFDVYQMSAVVGRGYVGSLTTAGAVTPLPQITTLTVGGSFASGAALYATLAGVTYNHTSVGGDTNLDGIATSFASIINAAAAYSAAAVGSVITVTGAVSVPFPVVAGVSAGDNTTTWALTQTASNTVAGIGNRIYFGWKNLGDPGGANAYPFGMHFNLLVQRIDPPLNLLYTVTNADAGGFTDYRILPGLIGAISYAVSSSGDGATYGFSLTPNDVPNGTSTLTTPASEPYNWTLQVSTNIPAVSGLAANAATGVTPATLRPQIVTLTLAGTPVTGNVYRATLGGVNLDYTATGGDTTMALVATGLAGVIDAHGDYIASAVGAVITITHASNNVPFTYSATVIASTVTLTAATTQEAA